ncbi:nitrilase-related carbon-nitrogen hydrolase [Dialister pneumosintes]|uniref:Carbon-nitrogen hydrolase n=1 Tax=Dialister pneumosintes TaxID=39950 RepID=A0A1B3WDV4_9FIRM|nr:nitrilase-related carbon-nitrogen hydrolase [Dialister pneumosintes]AOH39133.1 carbon-nitrogen hydrolase [Dialister pneumosintes]MBS6480369.1 carbon-nitrogen hydrolase [Dialister sp.]RID94962.1 carbon-nitrogen hydrolase [Dialister pneumosintes]CDF26972.1 putative uncharacterized protein [Dialister sp. CAG:588]
MKIGMIQMEAAAGNVEYNISHGFKLMEEAASSSDMVVLPELWTIGYNFHDLETKTVQIGDSLIERLCNFAKFHQITLIPGTLPMKKGKHIYNTGFIINKKGEIQASYSKRHLFHEYLEYELMKPGTRLMVTEIDGIQCGMGICFELYFHKMFRKMSNKGVTLVIVPAAWPANHIAHWNVLAKARAIENGIYVCAVNMVGKYKDAVVGGHSMFINPEGYSSFEGDMKEHIYYGEYEASRYKELATTRNVICLDKPDWGIR